MANIRNSALSLKLFTLLLMTRQIAAFYLPGMGANNFKNGDKINVFANSLRSAKTEIPYNFYHKALKFPRSSETIVSQSESLGAFLSGDRLEAVEFNMTMGNELQCKQVTEKNAELSGDDVRFLLDRIKEHYYYTFEVDDLPAMAGLDKVKTTAIPMGRPFSNGDKAEVFNVFEFTIFYHPAAATSVPVIIDATGEAITTTVDSASKDSTEKMYNVVAIDVFLKSSKGNCAGTENVIATAGTPLSVGYFYSVTFKESEVPWIHRWDRILTSQESKIHWFSIVYAIVSVTFLVFMFLTILLRALHRDISRYNQLEASEEAQEEYGWKLIHGDVFRTPPRYMALSVLLGNGAQLFLMGTITLICACFGFLSPSNRGAMITTIIFSYYCSAIVAGYFSARAYKMFGGEAWKKNVVLTVFAAPGILFFILLILDLILAGAGSSSAIPFGYMVLVIFLWFIISVPLCFVGAFRAFKSPRISFPVKINQIPRQVPQLAWYLKPLPSCLLVGILPFGAVSVELLSILSSIWSSKVYYVFGILLIVGFSLILTSATVSIIYVYFMLCEEDYRWWWRSFFSSASSGVYVFLTSILFFFKAKTSIKASTFFIYFGWSLIISGGFALVTGFIGFVASLLFVIKIYGSIKVD